jgi:hypothetical protein
MNTGTVHPWTNDCYTRPITYHILFWLPQFWEIASSILGNSNAFVDKLGFAMSWAVMKCLSVKTNCKAQHCPNLLFVAGLFLPSYRALKNYHGPKRKTKRADHEAPMPAEIDINFLKVSYGQRLNTWTWNRDHLMNSCIHMVWFSSSLFYSCKMFQTVPGRSGFCVAI